MKCKGCINLPSYNTNDSTVDLDYSNNSVSFFLCTFIFVICTSDTITLLAYIKTASNRV